MKAPVFEIKSFRLENDKLVKSDIEFLYVPEHLELIFLELLKNAVRATVEFHPNTKNIPSVNVLAVQTEKRITVRISDKGGGASLSEQSK